MNTSILNTDFYQLTMMQGYFNNPSLFNKCGTFDLFFRKAPFGGTYAILAGIQTAKEFIENFTIYADDVEYLRSIGMNTVFCNYLSTFIGSKDLSQSVEIESMREGNIVFPREPLIRITAPLPIAQLLETPLLSIINHETLVATKAHRIVGSAKGLPVMEFGMRRSHGIESSILATKAAFIGGVSSTSNTRAGKEFGIPISGTMSHAWIMSHGNEETAFRNYAEQAKDNIILLIDTYDTLNCGLPNAIKIFGELLASCKKPKVYGVRLDSGDLAELSKAVRRELDNNGFEDAIIVLSNDLDEYIISSLYEQGAQMNVLGVGTQLINCAGATSLGGVYKLSDIDGKPTMKISSNSEKSTLPGKKVVYRLESRATGKYMCDVIDVWDGIPFEDKVLKANPYTLSNSPYEKPTILYPDDIFISLISYRGLHPATKEDIKEYQLERDFFPESMFRFANPEPYKVYLSNELKQLTEETMKTLL